MKAEVAEQLPEGYSRPLVVVDKPGGADGCVVVDVSNLAYRSLYAYGDLTTSDGRRSGSAGVVFGSVRLLLSTMKNFLSGGRWCFVFCYDGQNAKALRQQVVPEYKANRDDGRFNPIPDAKAVLRFVPGLHVELAGKEGDDAIAWMAARCAKSCAKVVILTGDRDLWALTRFSNVRVLSPNLKRFVTPQDVLEHYLVTDPARIPLAKALFGDPSDGVRGVERLMKKHVAPMLKTPGVDTPEDFYVELGLLDSVDGPPPPMTVKTHAKLLAHKEKVLRNFKVVSPDLDGFGPGAVTRITTCEANRQALTNFVLDYEGVALAEQLGPLFGEPLTVKEGK